MIYVRLYWVCDALSWKISMLGKWFFRRALEAEFAKTGSCDRIAGIAFGDKK